MNRRKASGKSSPNSLPPADALGRDLSTAVVLFHEAIAAQLGMSATEWKCLSLLDQHGPSTAGSMAQLSGFTTGAITGIVDRLERAGYACREPHPNDRRSIVIRSLGLGELKGKIAQIFASLGRATGSLAARYTPAELAAIQSYLEGMIQLLRDETARLKSGHNVV
jgi:DNA-binding MarR family transcriptional regulator